MIIPIPKTRTAGEYMKNKGVDSIIRGYLLPEPKRVNLRADIRFERKQRRIAEMARFEKGLVIESMRMSFPSAKCQECRMNMWRLDPIMSIVRRHKFQRRNLCLECNDKLHNHGYIMCPCDMCYDYNNHDSDTCDCPECAGEHDGECACTHCVERCKKIKELISERKEYEDRTDYMLRKMLNI
jgi:hypothetical protein